jgi:CDP-diacylglycerol--glycerol-3-phosphate 3-phosphatidyltransferase
MYTLPNLLSFFRIAIIPCLVYLLASADRSASLLATALFVIAAGTDFLDGYLARRQRTVSEVGKILDPVADKLMVIAVLIMLAARPGEPSVPAWMVVVIVAREVAVTVLRAIALAEGIVMEAESLGKYKFVLQAFAITGLILRDRYLGIDFHAAGMYFLWIAMVVSVWSGVLYYAAFWRRLRARAESRSFVDKKRVFR